MRELLLRGGGRTLDKSLTRSKLTCEGTEGTGIRDLLEGRGEGVVENA